MIGVAPAAARAAFKPAPLAPRRGAPLQLPPSIGQHPGNPAVRRVPPPCRAGGSGVWRFDDLSGRPSTGDSTGVVSSFDDLWREQMRAMERAQLELSDMQRQMDQRFEAAQREAQQAGGSSDGTLEQAGPCGYRWQRSVERSAPGGTYREFRSESYTVIGVSPPMGCGMMGTRVAPPSATQLGPFAALGLLLAAAVAGFWVAATAAFHRRYHLTTYREASRWHLLLLWPLLLLTSADFRQQFWAAVRGLRARGGSGGGAASAGHSKQQDAEGGVGGEQQYVSSMPAGKQA